jgi:hypothetical protein
MNGNEQASDYDVLRAVSDSLSRVPLARAPRLAAVVAKGRTRRRRRCAYGTTAALAAAAAAVTVTALPSSSHPAGRLANPVTSNPVSARLAAWTVTRKTGGDLSVTVNELSDPAGLQRTLRADGVPASVTFLGKQNPACRPLGVDQGLFRKIFPERYVGTVHHLSGGSELGTLGKAGRDMIIDPAAIPGGDGLQLAFSKLPGGTPGRVDILGHMGLVRASQQCTGS